MYNIINNMNHKNNIFKRLDHVLVSKIWGRFSLGPQIKNTYIFVSQIFKKYNFSTYNLVFKNQNWI